MYDFTARGIYQLLVTGTTDNILFDLNSFKQFITGNDKKHNSRTKESDTCIVEQKQKECVTHVVEQKRKELLEHIQILENEIKNNTTLIDQATLTMKELKENGYDVRSIINENEQINKDIKDKTSILQNTLKQRDELEQQITECERLNKLIKEQHNIINRISKQHKVYKQYMKIPYNV